MPDVLTDMQRIDRLGMYKGDNSFMHEIFLYIRGKNNIYSSRGTYSLAVLTENLYRFDNWEKNQFYEDINSINSVTIRPSEKVIFNDLEAGEILTFLYPLPVMLSKPRSTLLFFIKKSAFDSMIEGILGDLKGSVYITDNTDKVMVNLDENNSIPFEKIIHQINNSKDTSFFNFSYENHKYSLIYVVSEKTGWKFITIMPTAQFLAKVFSMTSGRNSLVYK